MARLNENENENSNTGGNRDALFAGARYNSYKIIRQAFGPTAVGKPFHRPEVFDLKTYDKMGGWDAENKAWIYLAECMPADWMTSLKKVADEPWKRFDLDHELREIVDAAGEREDRFAEILHQRDAEGCITYWVSMLGIDPAKHVNTYQLIRLARKLGEMVVMCLKAQFNVARPSQLCPAIVPMFDPPRTASFPAGHALQSYLISYFLRRVMPKLPGSEERPKEEQTADGKTIRVWEAQHHGLFALARRVADNRVIAGVHYDIDNEAGFLVAREIDSWLDSRSSTLRKCKSLQTLLKDAADEFPQFKKN